jgi:hypothetical protein
MVAQGLMMSIQCPKVHGSISSDDNSLSSVNPWDIELESIWVLD